MSKSLYSQEPDKNYYQNCIIHGRFQFDQTVTLVSVGVFVYVYMWKEGWGGGGQKEFQCRGGVSKIYKRNLRKNMY